MTTSTILSAVLGLMFVLSITINRSEAGVYTVTKKAALNFTIDDYPAGQVVLGLYGETTPKTVANFATFCNGTLGIGYKGNMFHRIIKNFVVQGGDIVNGDGTGFTTMYRNETFPDENFTIPHRVGSINMANKGKDTNGCQFCFILTIADWLNGKHVVFAHVLEGMNVVHKMENLPTNGVEHPIPSPVIASCEIIDVPVPFDHIPA